jgi:hypothetical protein
VFLGYPHDALPSFLIDSNVSMKCKHQKSKELGHAPGLQHFGGKGVLELRDGIKKNDNHLIIHTDLHKLNNKLVNV